MADDPRVRAGRFTFGCHPVGASRATRWPDPPKPPPGAARPPPTLGPVTDAEAPVFPVAPPERVELPGGCACVRPSAALAPSAVRAINASLEHLRPWMAWAQEPATEERLAQVYADGDRAWTERTDFLYVVVDADGEVVGGTGLHPRLGSTGLEIGYWIHVDRAGRGLATEVARALTSAAFALPGIERVRIQCSVDNVASARVAEKLGFVLVGHGESAEGEPLQQWVVERGAWSG
jgi:RimJ/RimL family protein N-acetyltransferase